MSIEYKVIIEYKDTEPIDKFLRNLPCFTGFDKEWNSYNHREENNTGKMPNAEIKIEDEGVYLCDYGMSRQLFGLIVTNLISQFGRVQIEDYEI